MESMAAPRKYPDEVRDRAVNLVFEWRRARQRRDGGLKEVGGQLGMHPETLRTGSARRRPMTVIGQGLSTDNKERIKQLERENFELRRANETLKSASAFFGRELDPHRPR
jgi:transposase